MRLPDTSLSVRQCTVLFLPFILLWMGGGLSAWAQTPVFINEIHYDNTGTDAGEAIEVAGPAGTDLTGWSLVLYNGANQLMYDTAALSGTLSNGCNGFGFTVATYPTNGIQNGSPDGIALVDPSNTVVQFLSYEGTLTAGDGPANGMMSTDIGVSEGSSTPVGFSLQLGGTGSEAEDFTWQAESANTFGTCNTNQTFVGGTPFVVINEVDADTPSTDDAEFVELYDGGAGNTALDGLVLVFFNGSDDLSYDAFDLDGETTDAGGYFVLCGDAANVPNCDLDVSPNTNLIQNGADAVALYSGDSSDFPSGTGVTTTDLLDAIVYDTNDGDDAGLLVLLNGGEPQVNEDGNSDKDNHSNQRIPNGTGGQRNTSSYDQIPPTPGAENVGPPPPIVINEVDADTPGTDDAEFVELYDGGAGNTDLSGLVVVFFNGSNDLSYQAFDLDGETTDAGGYFVLCGDAANVPNCDLDVSPNTNLIQNGADAVALYSGDSSDFPSGTGVTTTDLLDALVYDTNDGDDAGLLVLLNGGEPQVNEDGNGDKDGHSNQRIPNGTGGQRNTSTYDQIPPTPGALNTASPPATVVINEVDADTPGSDAAEFVELYDGGSGNTALDGLVVVFFNGSDDASYNVFDLDGFSTNADGFFVLGNAAVPNVDLVFPGNGLQNGADAVAIFAGDASDFPNDTPVTATNLIDAVVYDTNDGDDAGLLNVLTPGQPQINEGGGAGGSANDANARLPDGGTPLNTSTYLQQVPTPGVTNIIPPTDVVINEVDADTPGSDAAEFVELYDGGSGNTLLNGLVVVFFNGSDDASYNVFDLDGFSTDAAGYFVLGNAVVPNVDLVFPGNGLQNGADAVALYLGDGSDFPNDTPVTTTDLLDAIVYDTNDGDDAALLALLNAGQPQVNEGDGAGGSANDSNQRIPNGSGGQRNTSSYTQLPPTPGTVNIGFAEIFEIQGSGLASPFANAAVTTEENVVTALASNGFFMQTPAARDDLDINTSNGIFVFTGAPPSVVVGDVVNVTGEVIEFFDFTEFSNGPAVTVVSSGSAVPAPVVFDGSTPSPDPDAPSCSIEFECYEGMLVSITGGSVSGPNQRFNPDPIAEVHIVAGPTRAFREPGIETPGLPGLPVWDGNPDVFELDPDRLGFLPNLIIPAGSSFDATGVLGFEFSGYELWPTSLSVTPATLPDAVRPREPGEATVGSLNLFRLFDDVDDPGSEQVVSAAEYARRLKKFSAYIRDVLQSPDVLAVQEAEKLGVLEDLAAEILADDPSVSYDAFLEEGNDIGGIDVGFLVRQTVQVDSLNQLGKDETFINPNTGQPNILHDRPPLLLAGEFAATGFPIKVLALHMRSLGGIEGSDSTRVRVKRDAQARSVAAKVLARQDSNLVVTGDFNAFEFTDGYVDVLGQITGTPDPLGAQIPVTPIVTQALANQVLSLPAEARYSFIFRGSAQVLDHALTSASLTPAVTDFAYGRGNADAAVDLINDDATPLRASDHDGLVTYLDVTPPVITVSEDPLVLWPPNHTYQSVSVEDFVLAVNEELGIDDVFVTSVTSDEPENANGDGNTTDDIVIAGCQTVDLRAERQGGGNGRVYTIEVAAQDAAGNVGTATFPVWVPKTKKKGAVDDGSAYEVLSGCAAPPPAATVAEAEDGQEAQAIQEVPADFALAQNYPNPFNPATTIEFALPEAMEVSLRVYDVTGRVVARLLEGSVGVGSHQVTFDASGLPSGLYFYRIQAGRFTQTRRMVLMK